MLSLGFTFKVKLIVSRCTVLCFRFGKLARGSLYTKAFIHGRQRLDVKLTTMMMMTMTMTKMMMMTMAGFTRGAA